MEIAQFRIWTQVAVLISYNDNHYATSVYHGQDMYPIIPLQAIDKWKGQTGIFYDNWSMRKKTLNSN